MDMMRYRFILASGSPRRRELISWLEIPFEAIKSNLDEVTNQTDPALVVQDLAQQKAREVYEQLNDKAAFVMGSDTIVKLD